MPTLRSVAKTDTLENQRQIINTIASDLFTVQTSVGAGAFSMSDGTVQAPALFFTNANDVGIFRGQGKSLNIAANGKGIVSFDENYITSLQNIRTIISSIPSGNSGITISNSGSNYNNGIYTNVPLSGGSGFGSLASVNVVGLGGQITTSGTRYVQGTYNNVPLTEGSGSGALATITISDFVGTITNPGSGGTTASIFTNVSLTGGSGSGTGLLASITTFSTAGPGGVGTVIIVSSVSITNFGSGTYQIGDVLSANSSSIGGVTGFTYTLSSVGQVSSVNVTNPGIGYSNNNILSASAANLGGSGVGFQFTVNKIGYISSVQITNGGDGYTTGDVLSIRNYELYPTVIKYVKLKTTQLLSFSGTYPTSGFAVNSNLTYNGQSKTIVKVFTSGSNIIAVSVDATSGTIPFPGSGQIATSSGQSATVQSSTSTLNYYFANTENPNNENEWTNIPDFTFKLNERYLFIQKHISNTTHPFKFSNTKDGFHTLGGVIYNGPEVNYNYIFTGSYFTTEIIPNASTPTTLYYFCGEGIADPLNNHINEGGFDNKEGTITISGSISPTLGSGVQISLGNITEEQNVLIERTGNTSVKSLSATSGLFTNNLTAQQNLSVSGNLSIGTTKFTVNSSSGNTYIDGTLTVNSDLFFLSDSAFGSTLFVDSINNRVSVNIDPEVTPLLETFSVLGDAKISGNTLLASDTNSSLKVGNGLSGIQKLQVSGSIYTDKFEVSSMGNIKTPQYTFASNNRHGLYFSDSDKILSVVSSNGIISTYRPLSVDFFRSTNFIFRNITSTELYGGSDYVNGSFNGVLLSGGTGSGAVAAIIVAFDTPLGSILGVGSISAADTNKAAATYTNVSTYTTNGNGTGATFRIVINASGAAAVTVTNAGKGYAIGDTITIAGGFFIGATITSVPLAVTFNVITLTSNSGAGYTPATYDNVALTGGTTGNGARATIVVGSSGAVTSCIVTNHGNGSYIVGDTISFDSTSLITIVNGNPIQSTVPSTIAAIKVSKLGVITKITISNFGQGYVNNDVLSLSNILPLSGTDFATITITGVSDTTSVTIDNTLGKITAQSINTIGSGILIDNNLSIDGVTISSTQNEDIVISPGTSSKILSVSGTGGVKLPVGNSTNRPAASNVGIVRYNTQTSQYEGSNGSSFISLGGVRDVDGNTYILAEETVGANDNILYFVNDGYNSARLNRTELELTTANLISSRDTDGKLLWKATTAYNLNAFVYYGNNQYQVTVAGTTSTTAPTHTTGAVVNGTATLNYISDTYGNLEIRADEVKIGTKVNFNDKLSIYTHSSTNNILESTLSKLKIAFGNNLGYPDTLISFNSLTASLDINKNFDTSNTEDNISILDKTLKFLELNDIRYETTSVTLIKGSSNIGSATIYNPTLHSSAKIIVSADNITTGDKQIVEYNVVHKATDIFAIEYGNTVTSIDLFDGAFDFDGSNNIRFTATLTAGVANTNNVKVTVTKTQIKK